MAFCVGSTLFLISPTTMELDSWFERLGDNYRMGEKSRASQFIHMRDGLSRNLKNCRWNECRRFRLEQHGPFYFLLLSMALWIGHFI